MSLRETLFGPVWRWPVILGIASACGLLSALIGDGVWDGLSWFALGAPMTAGVLLSLRRRSDSQKNRASNSSARHHPG